VDWNGRFDWLANHGVWVAAMSGEIQSLYARRSARCVSLPRPSIAL